MGLTPHPPFEQCNVKKKLLVEDGFPLGMVVLQKNSDVSFEYLIDFWIPSFHSHGQKKDFRPHLCPWPFDGTK